MRDEAERRIGHLYPKVTLPAEHGGGEATVIAWLWARTVKCPNPACGAEMPLVRSFELSTRKGRRAWLEPIVDHGAKTVRFQVATGAGTAPEPLKVAGKGRGFRCVVCEAVAGAELIHDEIDSGRAGLQPLATVVEGPLGRLYKDLPDRHLDAIHEAVGLAEELSDANELPRQPARGTFGGNAQGRRYGFRVFADYFLPRQLVALTTYARLATEVREVVRVDAVASGMSDDGLGLDEGGSSATAYAEAVSLYFAFALDKCTDYSNTLATWANTGEFIRNCFARQAIPMSWDFAECNLFSGSTGSWGSACEWVARAVEALPAGPAGIARQLDAIAVLDDVSHPMVSTDPPYYDNIGYSNLADFFYVWLRQTAGSIYPSLCSTLLTPKSHELVADRYRFDGSSKKAKEFFESGLRSAFEHMRDAADPAVPVTIYYAFKQTESAGDGEGSHTVASTGWETMLSGLLHSGFMITGTWPMRSERAVRSVALGTNALASSVVLVCRLRAGDAPLASRREFLSALKSELPETLRHLQHGNIAPVDLAQASIGPGMAVFSRYAKVVEADGSTMSVRTALELINRALDEVLSEQEGEFDADSRWAVAWFQETGMDFGDFGRADLLSRAKNTSVAGIVDAGLAEAKAGKVRLLRRNELDEAWDPTTDKRLTVWEMTQHLIRRLDAGEAAAAALARQLGSNAEIARDLAYRLYTVCERKRWAQEALVYNGLVVAWPEIERLAASEPASANPLQTSFEV